MEQTAEPRTEQMSRRSERHHAPHQPGWRPVFGLIIFGLVLTASLTIDGFSDASPDPGLALVAAGFMLCFGVANLLDPAARRLVAGVRIGGYVMALLGFVGQFVG